MPRRVFEEKRKEPFVEIFLPLVLTRGSSGRAEAGRVLAKIIGPPLSPSRYMDEIWQKKAIFEIRKCKFVANARQKR